MQQEDLASRATRMANEVMDKLDRWMALFDKELAQAEKESECCAIRELVTYTTALKRLLEIKKIAQILSAENNDARQNVLDTEALRALLSEED